MASGVDLGTAWIQIAPSMKGFKRDVASQMGDLGAGASSKTAGQKIMNGLGGAFKKVGKVGAGAIAGLGTAIAGIAVHGGISRALSIENAQAKLKGLGHDTKGVEAIMDSALASVKGTAFGLGDAATVAASLSATGLQAGKDLDGALKSVADVSQITGRSLTDVGAIFGSIAARGKLQGDDMLQLMSSGLPVLQMLSDELGVTTEQVSEMVSRGEIDFATFQRAMERGVGGAALAAGETFQGAWANIKAALGRIGADALTPVMNALRDSFNALIPVVDSVGEKLGPVFETVGEKIGIAAAAAVDFITSIVDGSSGIDLSWIVTFASGVWDLVQGGLAVLVPMLKAVWDAFSFIAPIVATVVGTFAGLVGQLLQINGVGEVLAGVILSLVAGFTLWKTVTLAQKAVTAIATGAQALFNAVMAANPVMLVVAAIGALVAALVYFFTQTELGREIWQTLVDAFHSFVAWIGEAWQATWQFLSEAWTAFSAWFSETWNTIWTGISEFFSVVWEGIKAYFSAVWNAIVTVIQVAWTIISTVVTTYINIVKTIITTVLNVIRAVWNTVWNAISTVVSTVWNTIKTVVTTGINLVRSVISSGINLVKSVWSSGWNAVASYVSTAWNRIKSGVSSGISGMLGLVRSIPGKILGALGNLGSLLYNAGASVIRGFINGIQSMIGAVKNTLSSLTSLLPDWKGPAKVDAKILFGSGKLVMEGFRAGLENEFGAVKSTLQGFTNDLSMSPVMVAANTVATGTQVNLPARSDTAGGGLKRGQPVNLVLRTTTGDVKLAVAAEIEEVLGATGSARAEFGVY